MTTVRFISSEIDRTVAFDTVSDTRWTLLSIARDAGIPLLFNCVAGDCGACVVHIDTLAAGRRPIASLTEKETFLLGAMCLLTPQDIADAAAGGAPPSVRLACQYEIRDESIVVTFESGLSGQ